jgi:hypothetical protein
MERSLAAPRTQAAPKLVGTLPLQRRLLLHDTGSRPIEYEDFSLRFELASEPGRYTVAVARSPGGEGRDGLGLDRPEIEAILGGLSALGLRSGKTTAEALGAKIFGALFRGEVRSRYDFSRGAVGSAARSRRGLRIRLHLEPKEPRLLKLCCLPWELLYDPDTQGYLGLDPLTPIVRHLALPVPGVLPPFEPPLRILLAMANPRGSEPLAVEAERDRIEKIWQDRQDVQVLPLERATLAAVAEAVRAQEFHVLHFVGHATDDWGAGKRVLLFEGDDQEPDPTPGERLVRALKAGRMPPRLTILNACSTAGFLAGDGPLAGVAVDLLAAGLPAVVATQFEISDEAALAFSSALYESLARGEGLEQAVTEGRRAISLARAGSLEWATPVLFLRTFDSPRIEVPAPPPPPPPQGGLVLKTFQKSLYGLFDDIGLGKVEDFKRLNPAEQQIVQNEIITRLSGLGLPASHLLEVGYANTRFSSTDLLADRQVQAHLGEVHRKSAIYADHSLVSIPKSWMIPEAGFDHGRRETAVEAETIELLLQHRPLVEVGKMSIVPANVVRRLRSGFESMFSVDDLGAISVDLQDKWVRHRFTVGGKAFRSAGTLVFNASAAGRLPLDDVLEIQDQYAEEYSEFQVRFRRLLEESRRLGDDSSALQDALKRVEEGIQELDDRYEKKRHAAHARTVDLLAGTLAVALYCLDAKLAALLVAILGPTSLRSCVQFIPDRGDEYHEEIRRSAFFIPWLIDRREG